MTGIETALLIILAVAFGILLIVGIVAIVIVIKILQNVQKITQKAETTTESLAQLFLSAGKKVAPLAASTVAGLIFKKFKKSKSSRQEDL